MIALAMTMVIGFAGLGTEVASWYVKKRQMQAAADAAAASAVSAGASGASTEAYAVAAQNGFVNGVNDTTVTPVICPSSSGCPISPTPANFPAAKVTISQPQPLLLASLFMDSQPTLSADAVAQTATPGGGGNGGGGGDCLLVLSPTANNALLLNGTVNANLTCGVAVDSSSTQALLMNGTNSLTATGINIVGNVLKNPSRNNTTSPTPVTGAEPVADPYGVGAEHEVDPPSFTTCAGHVDSSHFPTGATFNSVSGSLNPGVYCGNIIINGSGITVTFNPGTYILDRASLVINGGPTVTGDGVTIVFTTSTGSGVGTLSDNGNPTINFTAPSSGPLAGFVFYQDRRAAAGGTNVFNGNTGSTIAGAMYFPNQSLTFNGTPSTSSCTQVIAKTMTLNGTPSLRVDGCAALGLQPIGSSTSTASTATAKIIQ